MGKIWEVGGVAAPVPRAMGTGPASSAGRRWKARRERGMWLGGRLMGVAAPTWVPDRSRGRRVGGMAEVGNG